jgi:hypothetical protein
MKLLYKPFALIASLVASRLGRGAFRSVWAKIDAAPPPDPTQPQASWPKAVGAAALEAATMAAVAAVVDRASVNTFHHLTGIWPGEKPAEVVVDEAE